MTYKVSSGTLSLYSLLILIVHQSIVDLFASLFTLLLAVVEVDGTRMSPDNTYDQIVCHIWLTRQPLWYFLTISTCGILLIALDRYVSVIHPVWQNNNVRTAFVSSVARNQSNLPTAASNFSILYNEHIFHHFLPMVGDVA